MPSFLPTGLKTTRPITGPEAASACGARALRAGLPIGNDQHAVWLRVSTAGSGANYHVGYRSCFYGCVDFSADEGILASPAELVFYETHKT